MPSRIPVLDGLVTFVPAGGEREPWLLEATTGQSRWFPIEGGHRVVIPHEGRSFDSNHLAIEKGAWDHEHCSSCGSRIAPMTLCWVTESDPYVLLCEMCHATTAVVVERPNLRRAGRGAGGDLLEPRACVVDIARERLLGVANAPQPAETVVILSSGGPDFPDAVPHLRCPIDDPHALVFQGRRLAVGRLDARWAPEGIVAPVGCTVRASSFRGESLSTHSVVEEERRASTQMAAAVLRAQPARGECGFSRRVGQRTRACSTRRPSRGSRLRSSLGTGRQRWPNGNTPDVGQALRRQSSAARSPSCREVSPQLFGAGFALFRRLRSSERTPNVSRTGLSNPKCPRATEARRRMARRAS